jgi:hypothetical protein
MLSLQRLYFLYTAIAFAMVLVLEIRRRKLSWEKFRQLALLAKLDLAPLPLTAILVMFFFTRIFWLTFSTGLFRSNFSILISGVASIFLMAVIWSEAKK